MPNITSGEFEILSDLVYRKTGIRFESKKLYFITKRIEKRMDALGLEKVSDYLRILRFTDTDNQEFQQLTDLLTINETYFFRDFPQMQVFAEHCLPAVVDKKTKEGKRSLKIWSAGCSTGEEPYTLGIIISEMIDDIADWDIRIIAGDIDTKALEKARLAVYESRSIRDVPPEYLSGYFKKTNENYKVAEQIRNMIQFEHINLSDKNEIRQKRDFDFIFCRNMMIYFDDISRKRLVDQFYVALNPGGYIFLGSSESIGRISTAFRLKKIGGHIVYYKGG